MNIFSDFFLGHAYWPIDLVLWGICLLVLFVPYLKLDKLRLIISFYDSLFSAWMMLIIAPVMIGWVWLLFDGCRLLLQPFIKNA